MKIRLYYLKCLGWGLGQEQISGHINDHSSHLGPEYNSTPLLMFLSLYLMALFYGLIALLTL